MNQVLQGLISKFWHGYSQANTCIEYKELLTWFDKACVEFLADEMDDEVMVSFFESVPLLSATVKIRDICPEAVESLAEENLTYSVVVEHLNKMTPDQISFLRSFTNCETNQNTVFLKERRDF